MKKELAQVPYDIVTEQSVIDVCLIRSSQTNMKIRKIYDGTFVVDNRYIVNMKNHTCTCSFFVLQNEAYLLGKSSRIHKCKHLRAVEKFIEERKNEQNQERNPESDRDFRNGR